MQRVTTALQSTAVSNASEIKSVFYGKALKFEKSRRGRQQWEVLLLKHTANIPAD